MPTEISTSTLLPILGVPLNITTTSCSKVPQGLRFPLGVRGLFTTKCVQKVPTRDSDNLVKPFMHVAIQTTRHYATLSNYLLLHFSKRKLLTKLMAVNNFLLTLYVSIQFGLYHSKRHNVSFTKLPVNYFWRVVSEDPKESNIFFSLCFL